MEYFIDSNQVQYLTGHLLVASPRLPEESFFSKSIIYLLSHSDHGAVGITVNHIVNNANYASLLNSLDIEPSPLTKYMPIHFGGPVEAQRAFVLHTHDYNINTLFTINDEVAVSSNLQILKDIAKGEGPSKSIFALGYAGWQNGQLEAELENNNWLTVPFSKEIVFAENNKIKWELAMSDLGVNSYNFSFNVGHA